VLRGAPATLEAALRHALFGGGKRVRPALVRMVALELGGRDEAARAPAAAVELVHTYSLVHDDLPCMDDDDLRRGRPTCHKVFGEAIAVLAGDALQTAAFEVLAGEPRGAEAVGVLARAAGAAGMVGGQVLDLEGEGAPLPAEFVRELHTHKTGALIAASVVLGALAAGVDDARRAAIHGWGLSLGRLFQAVDDVLDVTGDAATLGKTPGKDERGAKPTLVSALGLDGARAEALQLAEQAHASAQALGFAAASLPRAFVDFLLERRS
jgi:farnesyl diphosphate synthase